MFNLLRYKFQRLIILIVKKLRFFDHKLKRKIYRILFKKNIIINHSPLYEFSQLVDNNKKQYLINS